MVSCKKKNEEYLLDIIEGLAYKTNSYTLYNFFYPKDNYIKKGDAPNFNRITFNKGVTHIKKNGKYIRVAKLGSFDKK